MRSGHPERGGDMWSMDDFCMGIELTCDEWFAHTFATDPSRIDDQGVSRRESLWWISDLWKLRF